MAPIAYVLGTPRTRLPWRRLPVPLPQVLICALRASASLSCGQSEQTSPDCLQCQRRSPCSRDALASTSNSLSSRSPKRGSWLCSRTVQIMHTLQAARSAGRCSLCSVPLCIVAFNTDASLTCRPCAGSPWTRPTNALCAVRRDLVASRSGCQSTVPPL